MDNFQVMHMVDLKINQKIEFSLLANDEKKFSSLSYNDGIVIAMTITSSSADAEKNLIGDRR